MFYDNIVITFLIDCILLKPRPKEIMEVNEKIPEKDLSRGYSIKRQQYRFA